MRKAVRAIVIRDNQLLVMHRNKFGKEYDTLPGGKVEASESLQDALVRELGEETGVRIANQQLVYIEHAGEPYGDQFIFLCDYVSGEPLLNPGSDEAAIHKLGKNLYTPGWVDLNELSQKPFVSERLKNKIIHALQEGWPVVPDEF
ncbi:MAG TPA: NUDIX domain-containing protein [Candidatus Limnocylindrales bacterium]|nr:NUDIX domain-containing protein [Candidatus Limnocylindrales bacterium]